MKPAMSTNVYFKSFPLLQKNDLFKIHEVELNNDKTATCNNPNAIANAHSIIWIQKGRGYINIDKQKFEIHQTVVFYVRPGQIIYFKINRPAKGFIISFKTEFLELFEKKQSVLSVPTLLNRFLTKPVIIINDEDYLVMKNIVEKMLMEYKNSLNFKSEILKGLLKIFIIYLNRQFENTETKKLQPKRTELVKNFNLLLEKHFIEKKMVCEYAALMFITPNYLNDTVKNISGFSASYHIQQRIILEAKRSAIFENGNMKEIAYKLGFRDPAHFSKFFKNISGKCFTEYKKSM